MDDPNIGSAQRRQAGPFGQGAAAPDLSAFEESETGLADLVDRLSDRFEQLEYTVVEHMPSPEDRARDADALAERLAALEERLSEAGTADLRDALDRIAEAQVRQAEALAALQEEVASRAFGGAASLRDEVAAMSARIDALAVETPSWLAPLLDSLAPAEPTVPPAAFEALREDLLSRVEHLASRPAPAPDLTAQRQSLSRFMAAGNTFLRRLETLVAGLASEHLRLVEEIGGARGGTEDRIAELSHVIAALSEVTSRLAGFAATAPDALAQGQREFINDLRMTVAEIAADTERRHAAE